MKTLTTLVGLMFAWLMLMATAVHHIPAGAVNASILDVGETLDPGEALTSTNGMHTLTMEAGGDLVLRSERNVVWASGTAEPGSRLVAQDDGNLVLRAPGGDPVWATGTHGAGPTWLEVHENGAARVHGGGGAVRWEAPLVAT